MSRERALDFWYVAEGGDVLHKNPGDPGGWTRYGIAQRFNPDVPLKSLTWAGAQEILTERYWLPNRCDAVENSGAPLTAWALFDFCANGNASAARKLLQRAVGVKADGAIGRKTLAAIRGYVAKRGDSWLAHRLCEARIRRQIDLARRSARQLSFLKGLIVRFNRLDVAIQRVGQAKG